MGVHVGFGACHLLQPEVVDLVEGANPNRSCGMAFGSLPSGLAGNGCRVFLRSETARTTPAAHNLAVGDHRNNSRCRFALGCGAICSARRTTSTRVAGHAGSDPAASLRLLPNRRSSVAEIWRQCTTHHVCAPPLHVSWRVLGKAVESWVPS